MNWSNFNSLEMLDSVNQSTDTVYLIFKHSTRCSISSTALKPLRAQLERRIGFKSYLFIP